MNNNFEIGDRVELIEKFHGRAVKRAKDILARGEFLCK